MGHLGLAPGALDYRPQDIVGLARRSLSSPDRPPACVIVGSPPEDEVGFGLAVGAVGVLRPRSVVMLDASARRAKRISTARLLATHGPSTLVQAVVGATSVVLQG